MNTGRRVWLGAGALITIITVGVIGYVVIEGWSLFDSLYMTIITITTVGYGEVHPLTTSGRIFSLFLIVGGVGGALYALTGIIQYLVEGNLGATWGRRRMKNDIDKLNRHFIICGLGRVGEEIGRTFKEEGVSFVVVDNKADGTARAEQAGFLYLLGDATSDEVLKEAGIERARGLVAAVGSDTDNTYIVLSARSLRPDLFIEARATHKEAETKLMRAGADRVVSPYSLGARRMALLALRPAVVDFIDTLTHSRRGEMQLENVNIRPSSALVGLTVKAARSRTGITILAIQKKNGRLLPNPVDEETIEESDQLIIIGTKKQLAAQENIFEGALTS